MKMKTEYQNLWAATNAVEIDEIENKKIMQNSINPKCSYLNKSIKLMNI